MTSIDSIKISATAEQIWPFLADPVGHAIWNEKVVDVRRDADQPVRQGERFGMSYRMGSKEHRSDVEVIVCDPPHEVVYRHQYRWKSDYRYSNEKYSLKQRVDQVEVTQEVDMSETGIPWFFRALIWFISRFGKSVGKSNMERLKEVVEESIAQNDP